MASWKWPNVLNKMLSDIPGINVLLNALLKQDVSGTTDVPTGAKQWVDTPEGKQFQVFNGQSWASVGKLAHDAASVDGYSASTGTTANTIPVRSSDGKIPGDIAGNAATASKAAALSATNPILTGGTGATTAEQARKNLVVPPKSHASGSTEYGAGTSTQYGHLKSHDVPDASLTGNAGHAFSPAGAAAMQDTLEGQIGDLAGVVSGNAAAQFTKDAAQDAAISAAQSSADEKALSFEVDGLDLVITYGNGSTERVKLPTGKGVGDLWWGHDPKSVPANVQLYSGQLLSRTAYEAHSGLVFSGKRTVVTESEWQSYASAHDGMCPYYSSGDGSTTYRMPCIKGVHPKFVAALAEAGQYVAAGLPNITAVGTGYWRSTATSSPQSGAAYTLYDQGILAGSGNNAEPVRTGAIDASLSDSIYGNSTTVQPPALTVLLGEYVVGSVAVVGEADAEALMEAINAKADADVGGKGVVRTLNGEAPDAAGGVSDISEIGSNFVRFTNGLQICWATVAAGASSAAATWTFPKEFSSAPRCSATHIGSNGADLPVACKLLNNSASSIQVQFGVKGSGWANQCSAHMTAIGRWK